MNAGDCRLPIVTDSNNQGAATASSGGGNFARALLGVLGKSSEDAGHAGGSEISAAEDTPEPNAKSPQTFATVAQKFYPAEKPAGVASPATPEVTGEAIQCPQEKADATVIWIPKAATHPEKDPGQAASGDFSPAGSVAPGQALDTTSRQAPVPQPCEKPAGVASLATPDETGKPIGDFSTPNGGRSLNEPNPTTALPLPVTQPPVPAPTAQSTPAGPEDQPQPVRAQGQTSFLPAPVWANPSVIPAWPRSAATAVSPAGQKAADVLLGRGKARSYPVNLPGACLPAAPSVSLPTEPSLQETAKPASPLVPDAGASPNPQQTAIPVVTLPVATLPAGGKPIGLPKGQKKEADTVAARPVHVASGQPAQPDAGTMASFSAAAIQPAPGAPAPAPAVTTGIAAASGGRGAATIAPASPSQNQQFTTPEAPLEDSVAAFEARLTASEPAASPARVPGNGSTAAAPATPVASGVPGGTPAQAITANLHPNGPASAQSPGVPVKSATGGGETRTTDEAAASHTVTAVVGSGQKPNAQKDTADPATAREPAAAGSVMPAVGTGDFSKAGLRDAATRPQASSGTQPEVPGEPTRESAESRPQPLREVSIRITSDTQAADVRMTERNGEIQVAVRASDSNLAHSLRSDVGDLVRGLSPSGLNAEVWHSGSGSQTADSGSSRRESGGQALVEQQDKQEQPSGHQQRKDERRQPGQSPDELD
jgi:hypothetical protein